MKKISCYGCDGIANGHKDRQGNDKNFGEEMLCSTNKNTWFILALSDKDLFWSLADAKSEGEKTAR